VINTVPRQTRRTTCSRTVSYRVCACVRTAASIPLGAAGGRCGDTVHTIIRTRRNARNGAVRRAILYICYSSCCC